VPGFVDIDGARFRLVVSNASADIADACVLSDLRCVDREAWRVPRKGGCGDLLAISPEVAAADLQSALAVHLDHALFTPPSKGNKCRRQRGCRLFSHGEITVCLGVAEIIARC